MILASHGIIASSIAQGDPNWVGYYNRVVSAGGSLTTTEQNATKTLVADLKAYGIWSKMKAIYPMVGASAAACAQNLVSSSFTGTFNGGVTFASTGVTGNGSTGYMNTSLNVNSILSLNSTHLSYYSRTNIPGGSVAVEMGVTGTTSTYLLYNYLGVGYSAINGGQSGRPSPASPTTGLLIGSRISNSEEKYYTNNISQTFTNSSTGKENKNIFLMAFNNVGPQSYSTKECAFASIGDGLTDTEASNFYTAVQAFQTTLSRNV